MKQKAIRLGLYTFLQTATIFYCAMSRIRLLDLKLIRPKSSPRPGLGRLGQELMAIEYSL